MKDSEPTIVNSDSSMLAFFSQVRELYHKYKYLTYDPPRIGQDRSLGQNSLFHMWCTQWIAYKLGKHYKTVQKNELAGIKRTVKRMYLIAHPQAFWMTHEITDYVTGFVRKDYTSSADWKTGEMFSVLEFMQNTAAHDGIILESKGKFAKLQRQQNI